MASSDSRPLATEATGDLFDDRAIGVRSCRSVRSRSGRRTQGLVEEYPSGRVTSERLAPSLQCRPPLDRVERNPRSANLDLRANADRLSATRSHLVHVRKPVFELFRPATSVYAPKTIPGGSYRAPVAAEDVVVESIKIDSLLRPTTARARHLVTVEVALNALHTNGWI